MNKSRSSHGKSREVMDKLHTSWELAEALKDLKTTIPGWLRSLCGGLVAEPMWWVVQLSCEIKAISAPSLGLGLG